MGSAEVRPSILVTEPIPMYRSGLVHELVSHYTVYRDDHAALPVSVGRAKPRLAIIGKLPSPLVTVGYINAVRANLGICTAVLIDQDERSEYIKTIAELGVTGFIDRLVDGETLLQAVKSLLSKGEYTSASLKLKVLASVENPNLAVIQHDSLSPRQMQILTLLAQGNTSREIAQRLSLAEKTIEKYISSIYCKLGESLGGKNHRITLVRYAIARGLVSSRTDLNANP